MNIDVTQQNPEEATDVTAKPDLDWLSLDDNEEVKWASTPHKNSILIGAAVSVALIIFGIGLIMLPLVYLGYKNRSYVITTKGVYSKKGVLSENVKQVELNKIQNTSYSENIVGGALGYGNVDISTAGGSGVELTFQAIPDPRGVRQLVSQLADKSKNADVAGEETKEDVLSDILVELREIRAAVSNTETTQHTTVETRDGTPAEGDSVKTRNKETDTSARNTLDDIHGNE